jgi:DivIVA domain-containing protein
VLTPAEVRNAQFTTTRLRLGYDQEEVDAFLDRADAGLDRLIRDNEEIRAKITEIQHGGTDLRVLAPPVPPLPGTAGHPGGLTPADVRDTRFAVTRRRPGYDQREVDAFLARTEAELDRLIRENDELRAQFSEIQHGGSSPRPPLPSPVSPPPGIVPGPGSREAGQSSQASRLSFGCLLVLVLFIGAIAIGAGVGVVTFHADYERSNYTQASGIPQSATVISENVGTGKAAETHVTVRLDTPVGGRDISVVNIAGAAIYKPGDRISILVDPRDPSYSELPGMPDDTALEALVACAIVILVMILGVVGGLVAAFRKRLRRRPVPSSPPSPPPRRAAGRLRRQDRHGT